jgi:hypothetical protein
LMFCRSLYVVKCDHDSFLSSFFHFTINKSFSHIIGLYMSSVDDFASLSKVKVKLSTCLTKYHTMKTHWKCGCIAPRIIHLGSRCR